MISQLDRHRPLYCWLSNFAVHLLHRFLLVCLAKIIIHDVFAQKVNIWRIRKSKTRPRTQRATQYFVLLSGRWRGGRHFENTCCFYLVLFLLRTAGHMLKVHADIFILGLVGCLPDRTKSASHYYWKWNEFARWYTLSCHHFVHECYRISKIVTSNYLTILKYT